MLDQTTQQLLDRQTLLLWQARVMIAAERRHTMPSALREDLMHPARVAHASMHQFARNAADSGNDVVAEDALAIAKQINALMDGQQSRPSAKPAQRVAQPRPNTGELP